MKALLLALALALPRLAHGRCDDDPDCWQRVARASQIGGGIATAGSAVALPLAGLGIVIETSGKKKVAAHPVEGPLPPGMHAPGVRATRLGSDLTVTGGLLMFVSPPIEAYFAMRATRAQRARGYEVDRLGGPLALGMWGGAVGCFVASKGEGPISKLGVGLWTGSAVLGAVQLGLARNPGEAVLVPISGRF